MAATDEEIKEALDDALKNAGSVASYSVSAGGRTVQKRPLSEILAAREELKRQEKPAVRARMRRLG